MSLYHKYVKQEMSKYSLIFLPLVNVMITLTLSGKTFGIQEVAPFWWESTKNISIASEKELKVSQVNSFYGWTF